MAKKGKNSKSKLKNKQLKSKGNPDRQTNQISEGRQQTQLEHGSQTITNNHSQMSTPPPQAAKRVQPEQMSLTACAHLQNYIKNNGVGKDKGELAKDDVTAVLRLARHLRLFGLLSAVGYINQLEENESEEEANGSEDKVRKRTVKVWSALLGQFINSLPGQESKAANSEEEQSLSRQEMMQRMQKLAKEQPQHYLAAWRKVMVLSHHWNFWARAYKEE